MAWPGRALPGALRVLAGLLALCVVMVALVSIFEERLVFFPDRGVTATSPDDLGLEAEVLHVTTEDGETIHGYYLEPPAGAEVRGHLLLSHGNAGNVGRRLPLAQMLVNRGLAVLLYDYRGYGHSTGRPTEQGVYMDGEAAYTAIVERAGGPERVVLYGRSLGGGVTWQLAVRHPQVAGVITDATFTSIPDMARHTVLAPFWFLARTEMNNLRRVAEARPPKLLLHGTQDELVPFEMAEQLHRAARPPVELVPLPGAGHNDTYSHDPERYFGAIDELVHSTVGRGPTEVGDEGDGG